MKGVNLIQSRIGKPFVNEVFIVIRVDCTKQTICVFAPSFFLPIFQ